VRRLAAYEDWGLILLGTVAVLLAAGLGATTAVDTHDRGGSLADAAAVAQRLTADGVDDSVTSDLLKLQRDEATYFQQQLTSAILPGDGDPGLDVTIVQTDLTAVAGQVADSAQVRNDVTLIGYRIPIYLTLEATALNYLQRLPIGTAYLQDASQYLQDQILPLATDIRDVDLARLTADDAEADAFPTALVAAGAAAVGYLLAAQLFLARRTRRLLNPGLLSACAMAVAAVAWAVPATLVSRDQVAADAIPAAASAVRMAPMRDTGTTTQAAALEWGDYVVQAEDAGGALDGLAPGTLLLGLAAGAAAGLGIGWRVAEYWSTGGDR
jgi:hypothetical protein